MLTFSSAQLMGWAGMYLWPFLRVLALFMAAPMFSHRSVPMRVKIGLGVAIAVAIAPVLPVQQQVSLDSAQTLPLVIQQVMIGLALGFMVRLAIAGIELAGELIGLQMGLSFAGFFDPQSQHGGNAVGSWLGVIATLIFLGINGHLLLIQTLGESFRAFPVGDSIFSIGDVKSLVAAGAEVFRLGLQLALPFIAVLLIVNLTLGVMVRVAPQLNLMSVGMPATITVGFASLFLLLPYLEQPLTQALERSLTGLIR
jgi:flagellar biosynthetic protein FliR